jgi:hypothetical protein
VDPTWSDRTLEPELLDDISIDEPWELIERFAHLERLSGSVDEATAVDLIVRKLRAWGIDYRLDHPVCMISLPGPATLRTLGPDGRRYKVKTPSFSPHTGGSEVEAELVYVPGRQATGAADLFSEQRTTTGLDLRGKVVMTEGLGIAARGIDLAESGAVAALFINPGNRIHEAIATTSWGSPDLDSAGRVPPVPVLTINRPDGEELIEQLQAGPVRVAFSNQVDTGWRPIPVLVAEIPGTVWPDEFVLLHGHLDSWHVGIGDNATGDATLLELARVFAKRRDKLARTLRIAWWSGHSHGRYAGSTWYADTHAAELLRNCVAHINCDSPGCRWATVYEGVSWMSETESFCKQVIRDVTGQESSGEGHVLRAGDCSFNNLGVTTFFMLSSTMPQDLIREKGYHLVGGCGGNIAWHTEDDTLEIADRDNLLRDMRVYAAAVLRTLNAPVAPFDYRATIDEMSNDIWRYQQAVADQFDFSPTIQGLEKLRRTLDSFYAMTANVQAADIDELGKTNLAQRELARVLVSLGYTRDGRFRHDPARAVPPLPDLAPATQLATAEDDAARHLLRTHLTRGQNHVVWQLGRAREIAERALAGQ